MKNKIRVLIVEDSPTSQGLLRGILSEDPGFEVIGTATDGEQAIEFVIKKHPDVVSMDIYMPVMDGVVATRQIMKQSPVPIVIVSSFYTPAEVKMSFKILEAGALTILPKPFGPGHPQYHQSAKHYRNTLKMMSEIKLSARHENQTVITKAKIEAPIVRPASGFTRENKKIVAIGASAGGPLAIQIILKGLPKNFPLPVLIVQHIDTNFASGFCDWLNTTSNLPVHIAKDGETLLPGHVYLAPGDHHIGLKQEGVVSITKDIPEKGLRPAVSYLFKNIAKIYAKSAVCILLSGMGTDGATELLTLRQKGAFTIAQDANSSLVHGMPGEAIRLGGACVVLSPEDIVKELNKILIQ
ncbi:MAG: chemotaxis-specific protein-glutamate methyltransferase CheB [Bacteroidota bacterium]